VKPKEACKSSNKLTILDLEETSPILNIDRKKNYFNNQYKRTEKNSNSLKINQRNEFVNKINQYMKEKKNSYKFLINKKDSKPTIVSTINNINNRQQNKYDFTSLAFKNKEKPINNLDFNNPSKEDDKNDANYEENDSSSESFEKEDKKNVVKTKFKLPNGKSSNSSENDEDKKDLKKKENINGKNKKLKLKDDIRPNRKMSFEPKDSKILNKNIMLSSVITKPGLNDDIEKTNQDSYFLFN
jgi:hypothetical protein